MTLAELHRDMTALLRDSGIERPHLAAEILIAAALKIKRIEIYSHSEREAGASGAGLARAHCRRLAGGEPLQRILGDAHFFDSVFRIEPGVFIPRPETEILVETAAGLLKETGRPTDGLRILDLCAGSGVVALSMLKMLPGARASAVEITPGGAKNIAENAAALGLENRIEIFEGDLYGPLGERRGEFDAIVANPPYIPTADILVVPPVVRDHDPHAALDGGPDGLDIARRIIGGAPCRLKPGGLLGIEVGAGQAGDVRALMEHAGLSGCSITRDLGGIERVVTAWSEKS